MPITMQNAMATTPRIVETAMEINLEIAELTFPPEAGRRSLAMLEAISTSLQKDLPAE